ncbi:hypothetical protein CLV58_1012 [Spirosoma oryzae]|uniref:Uncharacterized protein n=1 Tax=Spirosoma oryzae TaxID=1469603 RepID=A0A2T0TN33_9BACT|nr:hypothetical protein [Spirosoma oryzae]PRY46938.1 hypothetical protein CLV58_1012 [Spirosoma oryzae]
MGAVNPTQPRLRRYAFANNESRLMHWLPLVPADRVTVTEGILDGVMQGTLPNMPTEKT